MRKLHKVDVNIYRCRLLLVRSAAVGKVGADDTALKGNDNYPDDLAHSPTVRSNDGRPNSPRTLRQARAIPSQSVGESELFSPVSNEIGQFRLAHRLTAERIVSG